MKRNTPLLWDEFWEQEITRKDEIVNIMKVENSIGWQRILKIMLLEFGKFENLKVIEFGAGSGTFSVLMAKLGSHTTLLDYSENALEKAHMLFKSNLFTAEFIKKDALSLEQGLLGKYDVSMSFGLAEHFKGVERVKIIKNHFDVLRKGGMAFISIPNCSVQQLMAA